MLVAFSKVILVTTPLIGVRVLRSRAEYLRNRDLLVTGTRTSRGRMLSGRSRNSSTDSLHALALLSPSLEPKSLYGQWAQAFPSWETMLSWLMQMGGVPSTGSGVSQ